MKLFIFHLLLAKIVTLNVALAQTFTDSITCEMEFTEYTFSSEQSFEANIDTEDEWNCVDESDTLYDLVGDWKGIFDDYHVQSGVTSFTFRGVSVLPETDPVYSLPTIVVNHNSEIELVHGRRKLLVPVFGELEVMVVRVTDNSGEQPRLNGAEIANRVFGTFGDMASLKSQIGECSDYQLNLTASTRSTDIVDGILELPIEVNVGDFSNAERKFLEKVVNNKLKTEGYNVRSFGLVLYIMPETTNLGADNVLGYAYVGGVKSVYRGVPTFQTFVHEVGHNLGLSHSGVEGQFSPFTREYGDTTCQMGYSIQLNYYDYPQKCFNGAKSHDLGWYNQRKVGHEDLDSGASWRGKLVGVHDYFGEYYDGDGCEGHRVIANIGSLYIMFNRAESFTKDTLERNTITVTEEVTIENKSYSRQKIGGILSEGDARTFETVSGETYTVMVCDITIDDNNPEELDYADVIIFRNDLGSIVKSCDVELPTNTCPIGNLLASPPTANPSSNKSPTIMPSDQTSNAPTSGRTSTPTSSPVDPPIGVDPTDPTPPECTPSDPILIYSNNGGTLFDEGTPPIRITSQNTTYVNFEVANTFDATFTSVFTLYTTGNFGETECPEEKNIESLSIVDEYTAKCIMGDDRADTIVKIWVADGNRDILNQDDNAIVPKCCHPSQASQGYPQLQVPTAVYVFKLSCINPCTVINTEEQ